MKLPWSRFETGTRWNIWGQESARARLAIGWLVLTGTTLLLTYLLVDMWSTHQNIRRARAELHQLHTQALDLTASSPVSGMPAPARGRDLDQDTRRGVNRVIRHLNTPWPGVFATLERLTPPQIALLRIEPDSNGYITIEAESTDIDKVIAYASALAHQGVFGEVTLRRHITNDRDPNRPARLTFQIDLKDKPWPR